MFRCRNISMHAFARLFTSDLFANDCRVFDRLGTYKTMMKNICLLVKLTTSTTVVDSHVMSSSHTYANSGEKKSVHTVRLIIKSIQRIPY